MALTDFHGYQDSVRWRLVPAGVEIEGSGVERTRGQPLTVRGLWDRYADEINRTARAYHVPCALIVATICTESGGRPDAIRLEPGYVSDEKTPHKISVGLMQTLISTAREATQTSFSREWLLVPANSVVAGTAYIAQQVYRKGTRLDPPLVAAAYNAGTLAYQNSAQNRWKLRQYPLGTGTHVDRFLRFFNDAVFMLSQHPSRPAVGLEQLVGEAAQRQATPSRTGGRPAETADVEIAFAKNAKADDVTPYSRTVLQAILKEARVRRVLVSSTRRDAAAQARVMFENLELHGVVKQKELYGAAGDKVIDTYASAKAQGKTPDQITAEMTAKIIAVGATNVSKHAADPAVLNVFDIAPSSVNDKVNFERAVEAERRVQKFLTPRQSDPGYHLEIPQPVSR